jgi:hypothetical protein
MYWDMECIFKLWKKNTEQNLLTFSHHMKGMFMEEGLGCGAEVGAHVHYHHHHTHTGSENTCCQHVVGVNGSNLPFGLMMPQI